METAKLSSVKLSIEHLPKKTPETLKEKQPRKLPPEDGEVMDGSSLTVVNWVSGASHSGDNYRHNTRDSQKHVWECWKTETQKGWRTLGQTKRREGVKRFG